MEQCTKPGQRKSVNKRILDNSLKIDDSLLIELCEAEAIENKHIYRELYEQGKSKEFVTKKIIDTVFNRLNEKTALQQADKILAGLLH